MRKILLAILESGLALAVSTLDSLAQSVSLFTNSVPGTAAVNTASPTTLGLKFWSTQAGSISAIRFYRGAVSPEGYVAELYSAGGSLLGQAVLSAESGPVPGWQTVDFANPIPISANTTYVAAYYAPSGRYAETTNGLKAGGAVGTLNAPASATVGGNGVFFYGQGFPKKSSKASNYFVDVVFTPAAPTPYLQLSVNPPNPSIAASTPPGSSVATITATWSNGTPFTGMLSFTSPYSNSSGTFAISGNSLIINPAGPGVSADGGKTLDASIIATQ